MLKNMILFLLEVKRKKIIKAANKRKEQMSYSIRIQKTILKNEISKLDSDLTRVNSAIRTIKSIEDYYN